uniref:Pectinesterase inhibitor domain-containing protein n=1 Tax=Leersia perrieri TaxID=77586 RepID=A0A0D9WX95_9ORYZ
MAMSRSQQLAALSLAVLLVSAAPVAHAGAAASYAGASTGTAGATVDSLQDACNKTLFPKVCIQALTTNPESRTASARRLAELSVYVAAEVGTAVAAFAHHELNGVKEDALFKCVDSCSDDIEEAVAHLSALTRELTDAKFLEVKAWLSATLGGTSTCEDTCKDAPISEIKNAVVTKSLEFEKLLRVTLDLIAEASGSMSADVAIPPSSWNAAAPAPEGYGSAAAAPGPTPSEDGNVIGSGPGPAAAAAAPGPDAGAEGPTSGSASYGDAPSIASSPASSGYGAPAPSPGADAPEADYTAA